MTRKLMMADMTLEAIHVEEIIRRSGVAKTTFYRLFHDKYDVMNAAYLDASKAITSAQTDLSQMQSIVQHDTQSILNHPKFFRRIIEYKGQNSFRETIRDYYKSNILRQVTERSDGMPLSPQILFEIDAYGELAAYTTIWWIMSGCTLSPEALASYAEDCIPQALRPYFSH